MKFSSKSKAKTTPEQLFLFLVKLKVFLFFFCCHFSVTKLSIKFTTFEQLNTENVFVHEHLFVVSCVNARKCLAKDTSSAVAHCRPTTFRSFWVTGASLNATIEMLWNYSVHYATTSTYHFSRSSISIYF